MAETIAAIRTMSLRRRYVTTSATAPSSGTTATETPLNLAATARPPATPTSAPVPAARRHESPRSTCSAARTVSAHAKATNGSEPRKCACCSASGLAAYSAAPTSPAVLPASDLAKRATTKIVSVSISALNRRPTSSTSYALSNSASPSSLSSGTPISFSVCATASAGWSPSSTPARSQPAVPREMANVTGPYGNVSTTRYGFAADVSASSQLTIGAKTVPWLSVGRLA